METEFLTLAQAKRRMLDNATPLLATEVCTLSSSLGRVLAESVTSPINVPPFNASAMDGYAVNSLDVVKSHMQLTLSQSVSAGDTPSPLAANTTARVLTGAPIPKGADSVMIQEDCLVTTKGIQFLTASKAGDNIRQQGCHINEGQMVLKSGKRIEAVDIGLLASIGKNQFKVYSHLRVGVLSTGNELASPDAQLKAGQIYNSNHLMLIALLTQLGCHVIDLGAIADDLEITQKTLQVAQQQCDLIISSGGVSVGDKDYIKAALESIGQIGFWKIQMKPGKPVAFGKLGDSHFIGLPGNPVSCFITFCMLAKPFIQKCQGLTNIDITPHVAQTNFMQSVPGKRSEFMRVTTLLNDQGQHIATPHPKQDSATLLSISQSDGLLEIPANQTITPGKRLNYYPFSELLK